MTRKCVRCGIETDECVETLDGVVCGSHLRMSELVAEIRYRDVRLAAAETSLKLRTAEVKKLRSRAGLRELNPGRSIRRGLYHWFWHCLSIWDDREAERENDLEEGNEPELTERERADMQAALDFMFEADPADYGDKGDGNIREKTGSDG